MLKIFFQSGTSRAFLSTKRRLHMHHTAKGFTLIELMVVVGIIGILGTIATTSIISIMPTYSLSRAARDMVSNFRKARTLAIKLNHDVVMEFDAASNTYTVNGRPFPDVKYLSGPNKGKFKNLHEHYGGGVSFGFPGRSAAVTFTDSKVTFNSMGQTGGEIGYAFLQNQKKAGYRVGIRGMGNIVMDKCGQKGSDGILVTCLE